MQIYDSSADARIIWYNGYYEDEFTAMFLLSTGKQV
jgi:hypothetical protein